MTNLDFKGLKEFLLSIELMLATFCTTGFILFIPEEILEKIYLLEARDKFGIFIGIIFILSMFIVILKLITFFINKFKLWYQNKKSIKNLEKGLKNLREEEKEMIKSLTQTKNNTLMLPLNNGIVAKLESLTIIGKAASQHITDMRNPKWPYLLQPF